MRASDLSKRETAKTLFKSCVTVQKWVDRYRDLGLVGLYGKFGRGRMPKIPEKTKERIITEAIPPPLGPRATRLVAWPALPAHRAHSLEIKPHLT